MLQGAPIPLLFEIARSGASGKVRLNDGRRTVTLAVRKRNVVGIKGIPELWDRLRGPLVDTSECRGHLLHDIPRLMAGGVRIDQIFDEAGFALGRLLAELVDGDQVATFRGIAESDGDAIGLPKSLMAVVVEGLRTFRQPSDVRRSLAMDQELPLVLGKVDAELIGRWAPDAADLLEQAATYRTLDAWLKKIDRASRGRQDQFWRGLDLLLQVRALELKGSKRTPMAVRRIDREDQDSATPSVSGFSTFRGAPDAPDFVLNMERDHRQSSRHGPRSEPPEVPAPKPSWRRSEKVTLGEPDVFELPPDDDEDESAHPARGSQASQASLKGTGLDDHDDVFALPPDDDEDPPIGTGLDDHDDVFALPPDDDDDDEDPPIGTGLDDHDDVFALPPDDDDDSPSVVSFAAEEDDYSTEMAPVFTTTILDEVSEHVVRPMFTPRMKKKPKI